MSWLGGLDTEENRKFIGGISDAYNQGYDPRGWQQQQNLDRQYGLQKELHDAQMREYGLRIANAEEAQRRQTRYDADIADAIDNRSLGMRDPRATAAAQATARMNVVDLNVPGSEYDAAPDAPVVRGAKAGLGDTTRAISAAGLRAGKIDPAQFAAGELAARGFDWTDMRSKKMAEWKAMPPEQRAKIIEEQSKGDFIQGVGTYERTSKGGYLHYMPSGKAPIRLSDDEAAELYALGNLYEVDPDRASKEIAALRGNVRKAALDMFQAQTQGAQVSNTAQHYAGMDARDQARLGLAQQQMDNSNWVAEQYVDPEGNIKVIDVNRKSPGKPQFVERQMPPGLKPYNPRPPAEFKETPSGNIIAPDGIYAPDKNSPSGYRKITLGPSPLDIAIAEKLKAKKAGGTVGSVPAPTSQAPVAPQGNYGMFEAMSDDQLAYYARAGNVIAREVMNRRAAQPVDTMGLNPGY